MNQIINSCIEKQGCSSLERTIILSSWIIVFGMIGTVAIPLWFQPKLSIKIDVKQPNNKLPELPELHKLPE